MNIKRFWLLIGVITTISVLFIGITWFNNYQKELTIKKDRAAALEVANNFSMAWFNYTTQTSPSYLDKIKPFMTNNFYVATKYINTERPQDFEDQLPMASRVISSELNDYNNENAVIRVTLETKERGKTKNNLEITVNLIKAGGSWLVSSFK